MSNLEALIQAAQFIEENGRAKNGDEELDEFPRKRARQMRQKRPASYSAMARSRTTHNLLEKNRRAQLRDSLEVLRQHVPLPDKLTTLALLQSAKKYIESLKQKERKENETKMKLQDEQAALLSRLVELGAADYVGTIAGDSKQVSSVRPTPNVNEESLHKENILHIDSEPSKGSVSDTGGQGQEEDENVVIDVLSHESDDNSSTTSGSDGGCTSTSHKYVKLTA